MGECRNKAVHYRLGEVLVRWENALARLWVLLIHTLLSHDLEQKFLLGGCTLNGNGVTHGISPGDAFLLEFVSAFLLLFVGITVAFDKKRSKEVGLPWVCFMLSAPMGLGVFISTTITGPAGYSGVGLNPARCLGPALVRGGSLWHGHWVFWVAPILAC
ncbi:putative aquaporin TIP1-2 [Prunus yedoensis var. nudiflora]|uniref:Putative aquaporin TIP1-2 n=1 Tax=Prunus yedoensis var. nudiflora TaxID=2094558 RepID=A0A314XG17_PRUYE|nr:putative aquaporin TIP1-2 [Prunus yedoensis var. nudiflora]